MFIFRMKVTLTSLKKYRFVIRKISFSYRIILKKKDHKSIVTVSISPNEFTDYYLYSFSVPIHRKS